MKFKDGDNITVTKKGENSYELYSETKWGQNLDKDSKIWQMMEYSDVLENYTKLLKGVNQSKTHIEDMKDIKKMMVKFPELKVLLQDYFKIKRSKISEVITQLEQNLGTGTEKLDYLKKFVKEEDLTNEEK